MAILLARGKSGGTKRDKGRYQFAGKKPEPLITPRSLRRYYPDQVPGVSPYLEISAA